MAKKTWIKIKRGILDPKQAHAKVIHAIQAGKLTRPDNGEI